MQRLPVNPRFIRQRTWPSVCAISIALVVLIGCGPSGERASAPLPPPTPPKGVPTAAAAQVLPTTSTVPTAMAPLPPMPGVSLQCDDFATVTVGDYMIENNTWGKGAMTGWRQCVGLIASQRGGGVAGVWNWDWKYESDQVKAYPEVIFGHKPGYQKSTTEKLPRQLKALNSVTVDYDVNSQRQGSGNLSLDIWFTSTATPTSFSVPTITHEVMIWLDVEGTMYAGGQQVDETTINGVPYKVFVGENFGMGWRYIAFTPVNKVKASTGHFDLWAYFNYLRDKQWLGGNDYLAAINFGNEIISGVGETQLYHFGVGVK